MKNNFKNYSSKIVSDSELKPLIEYIKTKSYYYSVVKEIGKNLSVTSIINKKSKRKIQLIVEVDEDSTYYYVRINLDGTGRLAHVYCIDEVQYDRCIGAIDFDNKISLKESLMLYRK